MSNEHFKDLSRRAILLWAAQTTDEANDLFLPGYLNHQAPSIEGGTKTLDLAGWKALVAGHQSSFSNGKVDILDQVAEGHLVATRWRFTFTQTGTFMGRPPSGKEVTWGGVQTDRFADGKIAESWVD